MIEQQTAWWKRILFDGLNLFGFSALGHRRFVWKRLNQLIWIIILLLISSYLGRYWLTSYSSGTDDGRATVIQKGVVPVITDHDWEAIDEEIAAALQRAGDTAKTHAEAELNMWIEEMMVRVDDRFLDWYFSYWTQQVLGLEYIWRSGVNGWNQFFYGESKDVAEELMEKIQNKFATDVLVPQLAQQRIERITKESVNVYVLSLSEELNMIPSKYNISTKEWENYLEQITLLSANTEAGRDVPLTIKTIAMSGAGGTILTAQYAAPVIGKIGTKVSAKLAGKASSTLAAKTGGKIAAKIGGKFLGAVVGVGIIIWDVYDHFSTTGENRPILRSHIQEYLDGLKYDLLTESESGIHTIIDRFNLELIQMVESKS